MKLLTLLLFLLLLPIVFARPHIDNIPDQIIEAGESFKAIYLDDFVKDLGENYGAEWGVDGMVHLKVKIDEDNVTTIHYPRNPTWVGEEKLRFFLIDDNGEYDDTYVKFIVVKDGYQVPQLDRLGPRPPGECALSTGSGLKKDVDCDRVIDELDNCVSTPNELQEDNDQNGRGNVCDASINDVVYGDQVSTGRSTSASFTLLNNRPADLTSLRFRLFIPKTGVSRMVEASSLRSLESLTEEVALNIPACFPPGTYPLVIAASFLENGVPDEVWREQPIQILEGECSNSEKRTTIVDVYEIQDVVAGSTARYPITITNYNQESRQYLVSASGIDFGSFDFEGGSVLVIPPNAKRTTTLAVSAFDDSFGNHPFYLEVESLGYEESILLSAQVQHIVREEAKLVAFEYILLLLLIIGVLLAVFKHRDSLSKRLH